MSIQLRLASRNAFRRRSRTLLTLGMVAGGVALLLILTTWIGGATGSILGAATTRGGHVRVVDPDFAAREQLAPLEEHVVNVDALAATLQKLPDVVAVEPRIVVGVSVTVGTELGDVFGRALGANPSYFERIGARDKIVEGTWLTGEAGEVVAGATVVREAGAKIGDELLMLGVTQDGAMSPIKARLVGLVAGDSEFNQALLLPLSQVQWMTDLSGGATEVLVYGANYRDAAALAQRVSSSPAVSALLVESWTEREALRTIEATVGAIRSFIILLVVFLVALGIWNTMMMSVLERTHEIGVLRALGMTRFGTVMSFVGEAGAIGLLGAALGVLLGAGPSLYLERVGVHIGAKASASSDLAIAETIYGDFTLTGVVLAFAVGLLMALVGSFVPALRASGVQPVTAMRSGR
jgi:putative ABC transport system permease protein